MHKPTSIGYNRTIVSHTARINYKYHFTYGYSRKSYYVKFCVCLRSLFFFSSVQLFKLTNTLHIISSEETLQISNVNTCSYFLFQFFIFFFIAFCWIGGYTFFFPLKFCCCFCCSISFIGSLFNRTKVYTQPWMQPAIVRFRRMVGCFLWSLGRLLRWMCTIIRSLVPYAHDADHIDAIWMVYTLRQWPRLKNNKHKTFGLRCHFFCLILYITRKMSGFIFIRMLWGYCYAGL